MRLIDADALNEKLVQLARVMQDNGFHSYSSAVGEIINMVNQSKTIDAVPVVRCKDCKHWGLIGFLTKQNMQNAVILLTTWSARTATAYMER